LENRKSPASTLQSAILNRPSLLPRPTDYGPPIPEVFNPESQIQNPKSQIQNLPAPAVVRLKLVGANANANVTGLDPLPGKSNYFLGNDPKKWRTNVSNYAKVRYADVYPGVDLVYYGNQGQLEYDFVLSPGADPRAIKFDIQGAEKVEVNAQGNLVLRTEGGEVALHKPIVFQPTTDNGPRTTDAANPKSEIPNPKSVEGGYRLVAKNQVTFEVAAYDRSLPLIIDPVLTYGTYLGGTNEDRAYAVAADSSGNAYVAGFSYSSDFPTTPGAFSPVQVGAQDAVVAKISADGSALIFSTYLGGSGQDEAHGMVVDSAGNVYLAGDTSSGDFPTTPGALQSCSAGAFVTKLAPSGSDLIYSTCLGCEGANGIAVDASGNAFVAGGSSIAFVAKLNSDGSALDYSMALGTGTASAIAIDSSGKAYVTGTTSSVDFPATVRFPTTATTGAFVTRVNASGLGVDYSALLGGSGGVGKAIAVDSAGNAYVTGYTLSRGFPVTPNAYQPVAYPACPHWGGGPCTYAAFVSELSSDGSGLLYSTYFWGGTNASGPSNAASGIAVDPAGSIHIVGSGESPTTPDAFGAVPRNSGPFWAIFGPTWTLEFSTQLGGDTNDGPVSISLDSSGNTYIAGPSQGGIPGSPGVLQVTPNGHYDVWLGKFSPVDAANLFLDPAGLTFGDVILPTTSDTKWIYVRNYGTKPVAISTIDVIGDFAEHSSARPCVIGSPGGGLCAIGITFTPTAAGTRTGTVTITDDAPGSPRVVALTGNGIIAPIAVFSTDRLSFGGQRVGTTSPPLTVTLSNVGSAALTISIVTSSPFGQTNTCGSSVGPGNSCTIAVTFSPTVMATQSGELIITYNAPGSPQIVSLDGTGSSTDANLSLGPTSLVFTGQPLGEVKLKRVDLTNDGGSLVVISSITISPGNDFLIWPTSSCGQALTAGSACYLVVAFQPTVPGGQSGVLTIVHSAPGSPGTVTLAGAGLGPAATLSATSLDFGHQPVETTSAPKTVTLSNSGNTSMTVSSITASGDYARTHNCPSSLAAGSYCTISVTFTPTAAGSRTGALTITDNASGSPRTVTLAGVGTDFMLSGDPTSRTVTAGQPATYTLSVGPVSGFNQSVALTCAKPTQLTLATCSVSPSTVTPDGSNAATVTVTVTTTARGMAPPVGGPRWDRGRRRTPLQDPPLGRHTGLPLQRWLLALLAVTVVAAAFRPPQANVRLKPNATLLPLTGMLLLALLWAACGGGGGTPPPPHPGTPAGTYSLTIAGTVATGSGNLSHGLTLTLKVN
jgi:hypothetical protein